jgi:hypothetical protein
MTSSQCRRRSASYELRTKLVNENGPKGTIKTIDTATMTRNRSSSSNNRTRGRISIAIAAVFQVLLLWVVLAPAVSGSSSIIQVHPEEELHHAYVNEAKNDNDEDSSAVSQTQEAAIIAATTSSAHHHRHLLLVDPKVKERFLAAPPGYRKHPSYYSEIYLRRAREITDAERNDLTEQWGSWTLTDSKRSIRPADNFYMKYPNRDVPFVDFPPEAWQRDKDYVAKFLDEGIDLTMRAMEAILAEYGNGPATATATYPHADFVQRSAALQVEKVGNDMNKSAGGWIPQQSWDGLKRRLLHAVMTEDSFNLVMGGHSSAAGMFAFVY